MNKRFVALATAAATMVAAPVVANAATPERTAAPVSGEQEFGGDSSLWIVLLAVAAVIAGIIIIADDEPTSP